METTLRCSNRSKDKYERLNYGSVHQASSMITFPITITNEPKIREAMNSTKEDAAIRRNSIKNKSHTLEIKEIWTELVVLNQKKSRFRLRDDAGNNELPTYGVIKLREMKMETQPN